LSGENVADYLKRAKSIEGFLKAVRRDLHENPELSFEEVRTAGIVSGVLDKLGIPYKAGIAKTGVVAELGEGDGPVVGLRADMDALPILESNEVAYRSKNDGVMHACGHDAHTTCLLGAATLLKEDFAAGRLKGRIRFLFQPSEEHKDAEGKSGGLRMVEEGALKGLDAVFGLHVISTLESNKVFLREGPFMAAVDSFQAFIVGRGGHGANPHEALDPIWLAAQVINGIHGAVSRRKHPMEPGLITVTQIHAGTADNIIPVEVEIRGTIRSFLKETRETLHKGLEEACALARAFGGDYRLQIFEGYPVTANNPEMARFVKKMAEGMIGKENVKEATIQGGAEDFSYMAQAVPGAFFFLGAKLDSVDRQHHAPNFDIDEAVLPTGAALMAEAARAYLAERAG
jgi:amidohydrolase